MRNDFINEEERWINHDMIMKRIGIPLNKGRGLYQKSWNKIEARIINKCIVK